MKADAGNLKSKRSYFSGRFQKGKDYDTGLTVGEWVIHGCCYIDWKRNLFSQKQMKLMKYGLWDKLMLNK